MAKAMTYSEKLVGRRLPAPSKYIDILMAGFVTTSDAGPFCGRMQPIDRWMQPAHRKARQSGWITHGALSFEKGMGIWFLTERGKPEALAAKSRVDTTNESRAAWGRDCAKAFRQHAN